MYQLLDNPLISKYPLFLPDPNKWGINLVGDILNSNGQIITRDELTKLNQINYIKSP